MGTYQEDSRVVKTDSMGTRSMIARLLGVDTAEILHEMGDVVVVVTERDDWADHQDDERYRYHCRTYRAGRPIDVMGFHVEVLARDWAGIVARTVAEKPDRWNDRDLWV